MRLKWSPFAVLLLLTTPFTEVVKTNEFVALPSKFTVPVKVSPDLSSAKVYVSIFPNNNYLDHLRNLNSSRMRHDLSQRMKKQLSKIPQLSFYIDDSLDYIENIEKELKAGSNPFRKSTK